MSPSELWVRVVVIGLSERMKRPPGKLVQDPGELRPVCAPGPDAQTWLHARTCRSGCEKVWQYRYFHIVVRIEHFCNTPIVIYPLSFSLFCIFLLIYFFLANINNISSPSCNYCNRFAIILGFFSPHTTHARFSILYWHIVSN